MNALRGSLGAEWIKLWTVRSTWWALGAVVAMMGGFAAIMGSDFAADVESGETADGSAMAIAQPAADAAVIAQLGLVAFAMLVVTAEFSTGAIRGTLAADPRRGRVLLAKALVVAAVTVPLAAAVAVLGVLAGDATLGEYGTGGPGAAGTEVAAITAYLTGTALITLGAGAVLRSSVGTFAAAVAVLLAMPMMFASTWASVLPGGAGLVLLGRDDPPFSRLAALGIFALWTGAALLAGYLSLRRRDV